MSIERAGEAGLWVDPAWDRTNPGTFAIVIGVSRYDYLNGSSSSFGLDSLYVSASTAYSFFLWLREHYRYKHARLARCWLLLAPTYEELQVTPSMADDSSPATFDACQKAIREWYDALSSLHRISAEGSRSFFYFSGHGLEITNERQLLLPSDYLGPRRIRNDVISTENIYNSLAGVAVPHQFFFFDACRSDALLSRDVDLRGNQLLDERKSAHLNNRRTAPIFYATGAGDQSWQPRDPRDGLSLFGQALMEALAPTAASEAAPGQRQGALKVAALQSYLRKRVAALIAEQDPGLTQEVHVGGVTHEEDVVVSEVAGHSTEPGASSQSSPLAAKEEDPVMSPAQPVELQPQLRAEIKRTLLNCAQLGSHDRLDDFFGSTELIVFRNNLPEARGRDARVDALVAYLLNRKFKDGRPAFVFCLEELSRQYPAGDDLHDQLKTLAARVKRLF